MLIGDGRYNTRDHPIVYHRQDLGKVPKKLSGEPAPDLEEAFDVRYRVSSVQVAFNGYLHGHYRLRKTNPRTTQLRRSKTQTT